MTLVEIKDWLKAFEIFDYYYVGKVVGKQEKVLGVYSNGEYGSPVHAIGIQSSYERNRVKLLVHWNKYQDQTQNASNRLFDALTDVVGVDVGDNTIYYVDLLCNEPIDVGTDANDIYEYVITMDIYSKRR